MTSTRALPDERTPVTLEDFIKTFDADLRWPLCPGSAVPEIIAHYQAENEPGGADRALQRSADLRLSDTRVVTHRDFNNAESGQGAFQDHLNRPAIGGLFECECA